MEKPKSIEKKGTTKHLTQLGVNRAFWKLLAGRGGMTIRASELMNLPVNAGLKADVHN